jgi:AcrR family transcriptional regulator
VVAKQALPTRRRHGAVLEDAVLEASWAVLRENGYAGFTLGAVASRAGTSRPVIARRWPSRHDLVLATIAFIGSTQPSPRPDTGSLRGDLMALMHGLNNSRLDVATVLGVQLGGYYQETGNTLADLRDVLLSGEDSMLDHILDAAVARGEANPARLTPRVRSLPVDLLRHYVFTAFQPMPDDGIEEIVDDIFLPLVRTER